MATTAIGQGQAIAEDADAFVERLGLREGATPLSDTPGWRKPRRVLVRIDSSERLADFQSVAPGVELIPYDPDTRPDDIDASLGICDSDVLSRNPGLRWVQLYSAGVERCIGVMNAVELSPLLTNMQRVHGPPMAEHTIAMMLAMTRSLPVFLDAQKAGKWDAFAAPLQSRPELEGSKLLVVGLGGIGTEIARDAAGLGMRVTGTRNSSRSGPDFVDYVGLSDELHDLAAEADFVVNVTPLTDSTRGLFDAEFFSVMKPTAYFVNVGRGPSVVTDDLMRALEEKSIAGAALDVTDPEPLPPTHPLWQTPNVIITPHVSASSMQQRERVFTLVKENLRRYVAGEPLLSVVDVERGY